MSIEVEQIYRHSNSYTGNETGALEVEVVKINGSRIDLVVTKMTCSWTYWQECQKQALLEAELDWCWKLLPTKSKNKKPENNMEKKYKPTWTFFWGQGDDGNNTILLVRSTDDTKSLETARELGFEPNSWVWVKDEPNKNCWEGQTSGCGQLILNMNLPKEFNLQEIAKHNSVQIVDVNGKDLKEKIMSEGVLSKAKTVITSSAKDMSSSAFMGLKLASVNRANEAAYEKLKEIVIERFGAKRETLEDPVIKAMMIGLLPCVLHPAAIALEGTVPQAKIIKEYATISMTENSRQYGDQAFSIMKEIFSTMVAAGAGVVEETSAVRIDTSNVVENYGEYGEFTVLELKKKAKERQIKISGKAKKSEILEALREADSAEEEVPASAVA